MYIIYPEYCLPAAKMRTGSSDERLAIEARYFD